MDNFIYIFTRQAHNKTIMCEEKEAYRLLNDKSGWEAKDISYIGRVPVGVLSAKQMEHSDKYKPRFVRDSTQIDAQEIASINADRKLNQEEWDKSVIALAKKHKDLQAPRDYSVLTPQGVLQTNSKVLSSI